VIEMASSVQDCPIICIFVKLFKMKKLIIAIDGYSSCGKSTTAKLVARELEYVFIDSGAMYRAVTHYLIEHDIASTELEKIHQALPNIQLDFRSTENSVLPIIHLNGICIEDAVRSPAIANVVSEYSAVSIIRKAMVKQQQLMGLSGGVVMDGRDIGTIVFPDAELKIFLTADIDIRVKRRALELSTKGYTVSDAEIKKNLLHRDFVDTTRLEGPLRKADDAMVIDTSHLSIEDQVSKVLQYANEKILTYAINT
jgi:cytidylate kinase